VYRGYLQKRKDFKTQMRIDVCGYVFGYALVSLSLIFAGYGSWSLVIGVIVSNLLVSLQLFMAVPFRFGIGTNLSQIFKTLKQSAAINLTQLIGFVDLSVTRVIIAKLLGPGMLALFNMALYKASLPLGKIAVTLSTVMFSVYCRNSDDSVALRREYLKTVQLVSVSAIPVLCAMWIAGDFLIVGLFGDSWLAAVPAFKILCIAMLFNCILNLAGSMFQATNNVYKELRMQALFAVSRVSCLLWFIGDSLETVAIIMLVHAVLMYFVVAWMINRIIDLHWGEYLRAQSAAVFLVVPLMVGIYLLTNLLIVPAGFSHELALFLIIVASAIIYLTCLLTLPDRLIGNTRSWCLGRYSHRLPMWLKPLVGAYY
jgi:O-antigen/teichoic acid export membrane protein